MLQTILRSVFFRATAMAILVWATGIAPRVVTAQTPRAQSPSAQKGASLAKTASTVEDFVLGIRATRPQTRADSILAMALEVTQQIDLGVRIPGEKCLTSLMFEAHLLKKEANPKLVHELGVEPSNQASMLSPEGHFRIYYDNTGPSSATPEFVASMARTADSAFDFEITELGYPKPPFTDSDSTFHLHIVNQPPGYYGFTSPTDNGALGNSPSGLELSRTFIVIDNDFVEPSYATHGSDAVHVTVFHEFQHLIQYGDYGVSTQGGPDGFTRDSYFKELTSVWMETISHPEVKDYLQYLGAYLPTINLAFNGGVSRGYGQAIWLQYLEKMHGAKINREIWEQYSKAQPDPVYAMEDVLRRYSSSFCNEYKRFGTALFFTGRHFDGSSPFPDARQFVVDSLNVQVAQLGVSEAIFLGAVSSSLNFFAAGIGRDTIVVVVARDTNRSLLPNGSITINSASSFSANYQHPEAFCDTIAGYRSTVAEVFPQPFILHSGGADSVAILASNGLHAPVSVLLDIYSMNMTLIKHLDAKPQPFTEEYYATWSGRDDNGRLVPSGIYLYTIDTDGNKREGKIAVVRGK